MAAIMHRSLCRSLGCTIHTARKNSSPSTRMRRAPKYGAPPPNPCPAESRSCRHPQTTKRVAYRTSPEARTQFSKDWVLHTYNKYPDNNNMYYRHRVTSSDHPRNDILQLFWQCRCDGTYKAHSPTRTAHCLPSPPLEQWARKWAACWPTRQPPGPPSPTPLPPWWVRRPQHQHPWLGHSLVQQSSLPDLTLGVKLVGQGMRSKPRPCGAGRVGLQLRLLDPQH
jgi:hypothetical protein